MVVEPVVVGVLVELVDVLAHEGGDDAATSSGANDGSRSWSAIRPRTQATTVWRAHTCSGVASPTVPLNVGVSVIWSASAFASCQRPSHASAALRYARRVSCPICSTTLSPQSSVAARSCAQEPATSSS